MSRKAGTGKRNRLCDIGHAFLHGEPARADESQPRPRLDRVLDARVARGHRRRTGRGAVVGGARRGHGLRPARLVILADLHGPRPGRARERPPGTVGGPRLGHGGHGGVEGRHGLAGGVTILAALAIEILRPARRFGQEVERIVTVTDRRRQQLDGGPVHHGLATLEPIPRSRRRNRPRPGPGPGPRARARPRDCTRIHQSGPAGLGERPRRRSRRCLDRVGGWWGWGWRSRGTVGPRRSGGGRLDRGGIRGRGGRRRRIGRCAVRGLIGDHLADHHPFIPLQGILARLVDLGGLALPSRGGELASLTLAATTDAGWRTGVIDA